MQRGSVLPLLMILVVLLLLGGGAAYFLLYSKQKPAAVVETVPLKNSVLASPSPGSSTQTVSNDLLSLKFDLPKGYSLVKESEEEYFKRANGDIRKNFNGYIFYPPAEFADSFYVLLESEKNPDKAELSVWVFKNPDNLNAQKFYEKYWYYPFVWGDFTQRKYEIAPEDIELIGGKEGNFGIIGYREGKPEMVYLPLKDKNLMMQIQFPSENVKAREILKSFKFE